MFVPDSEADFAALLQGDIVKEIPLIGALALEDVSLVGKGAWGYGGPLRSGPCAVVSHSCEIAAENGEKVTSCLLAPVRKADGATTPELFEILKRNEVKENENNFVKYFYIPPNDKLQHANGSLVDFSKIFSLRKSSIQTVTAKKILQMTSEHRAQLGRKLALYFYRGTGEEAEVPRT